MTALLNQIKRLYGAEMVNENKLGNSANIIFEMVIRNQPVILRISKYSDSKKRHVNFELAWLQYLVKRVPCVAGPIESEKGNLYEVVQKEGERWIACVFQKAPGHMVDPAKPSEWNDSLFQSIGEVMGKIHTNTKPYAQQNRIDEQLDWRHSYLFWPENNQCCDPDIQSIWNHTLAEMESLPRSQMDYGIVHTDIHYQNFHVKDGKIILFDFDDCEYSWYAYDIASTLFFMTGTADFNDAESGKAMLEHFGRLFLGGYKKYAELPLHWLEMLPLFLRYRRLAQYKYFYNFFHGQDNPYESYLSWAKQDIISDFPYLRYDFCALV